jgi:hypothetical protein
MESALPATSIASSFGRWHQRLQPARDSVPAAGLMVRRKRGLLRSVGLLGLALLASGRLAAAQSGAFETGWNDYGQCSAPPLPTGHAYVSVAAGLSLPGSARARAQDVSRSPDRVAIPGLPERDYHNVPREEHAVRPAEASVRAAFQDGRTLAAYSVPDSVVFDEPGDGAIWVLGRSYKARVDSAGLTYIPFLGSRAPRNYPVVFGLRSASIGGQDLPLANGAPPIRDEQRIYVLHGSVTEVLDFALDSVEQSFVVERGEATGELDLELDVETDMSRSSDASGQCFFAPQGSVHYGLPTTLDAVGRELSTSSLPTARGMQFTISADEVSRASGDLTIDPIIATVTVDTSSLDDRHPDVAYDATFDRYLVVCERVFSQNDHDVLCQMLDGATAQPIANTLSYIDFTGNDWRQPSVANMNGADVFLVAASVGPAPEVITCRTRFAASLAMGPQFVISQNKPYGSACGSSVATRHFTPVVGGDTWPGGSGKFCVVWVANGIVSTSIVTGCPTILFCTVTASGVATAPAVLFDVGYAADPVLDNGDWASLSISKSNGDSYSAATQDWNVVWLENTSSYYNTIFGAQIHWNGVVTHSSTALLSDDGPLPSGLGWPPTKVAVSSSQSNSTRQFLVTWEAGSPGSTSHIWSGLVNPWAAWGTLPASALYDLTQLQGNPGAQWQPAVDCDGTNYVVGFNAYPGGITGLAASEFGMKYHKFYGWYFACVEPTLQAQIAISNQQMGRARICAEASGSGARRNALIGGTNWAGYGSGGYYFGDPIVGLHAH